MSDKYSGVNVHQALMSEKYSGKNLVSFIDAVQFFSWKRSMKTKAFVQLTVMECSCKA